MRVLVPHWEELSVSEIEVLVYGKKLLEKKEKKPKKTEKQ